MSRPPTSKLACLQSFESTAKTYHGPTSTRYRPTRDAMLHGAARQRSRPNQALVPFQDPKAGHMSFAGVPNMRLAPSAEVACSSAGCRDVHMAQPSSRRCDACMNTDDSYPSPSSLQVSQLLGLVLCLPPKSHARSAFWMACAVSAATCILISVCFSSKLSAAQPWTQRISRSPFLRPRLSPVSGCRR